VIGFDLLVISDWSLADLPDRIEAVLARRGRVAVQHRHPGISDRQFLEEARVLAACCRRHQAPFFVNGRLDVALLTDAHLHLPTTALRVEDVRPLLKGKRISAAVHSLAEAQAVDLALVSHVFAPGSKPDDTRAPLGPDGFFALARALPCPAFALGGVTAQNARLLSNAVGLAAISAVLHAASPADAITALDAAWKAR
jgi:thiamine-phosphate pyrophosphorylase